MLFVSGSTLASCGRPEGEKYDVTTKILPSSVHPSSFTAADPYDARAPRSRDGNDKHFVYPSTDCARNATFLPVG